MKKFISKYAPQEVAVPKPKPHASLAALQWAADRAGQSYGTYTLDLTPDEEVRIQLDFEDMLRQRKVEMARRAARVENEGPVTGGFIITDDA